MRGLKRRTSDMGASPAPSSGAASSKLVQRTVFLAVLALLSWTVYTHREQALSASYGLSDNVVSQLAASQNEKASSYPFAKTQFKLQEPSYEVLIMKTTIQHQNETWRQVTTKNGNSWLMQSVAWIRIADGGLRPELTSVAGWCKTLPSDDPSAAEQVSVKAEVKVLWTDYRDRGIDQDTLLWVECDATPLLRQYYNISSALPAEFSSAEVREMESVQFDFAFEHDLGTVETSTSGKVPLVQWYTAMDVEVEIAQPLERVKMTACLSPAFYDKKMPILKWLEWREHLRNLGVQRVAWYGRQESMGDFVTEYNRLAATQDIFRYAPPLGDQGPSFYTNPYHDQDAWYGDCVLTHRQSSDFLLILDVDEYPMTDFSDPARRTPAQQWLEHLESIPADRGMVEMTRIPMSANPEELGKPDKERMSQDQLQCVNGIDKRVKSFYKSSAVMTVNQHKKTRMYPLGEELAKQYKAKPDRPYWEQNWDSSVEGVWPKLFHYRWFSDDVENGCTHDSPYKGSAGYTAYLNDLRRDVMDKKAKIELALGL